MQLASLDLDLEVFQGPFDLLLALVLREEVDLLEVDLAEIVLTYIAMAWRGEVELGGRGLLLVPTAFSWQRPSLITLDPWQPSLIYPARKPRSTCWRSHTWRSA